MVKKFQSFIKESIQTYSNVTIDTGDDADKDEPKKFEIIKKYFPFNEVSGTIKWEEGTVDLNFDNGKFLIKGKYDPTTETLPSIFTINGDQYITKYNINFHFHGSMSGQDLTKFENEIKKKEGIGSYGKDDDALMDIFVEKSLQNNKDNKYKYNNNNKYN